MAWYVIDQKGLNYLSPGNLGVMTQSGSWLALLAIGSGIVMMVGEIDLSVGANMGIVVTGVPDLVPGWQGPTGLRTGGRPHRSAHLSSVLVTHNLHHAFQVCDRHIVMNHGEKILDVRRKDTSVEELTAAVVSGREGLRQVAGSVENRD